MPGCATRLVICRPGQKPGPASVVATNRLQQHFVVAEPNDARVSDITHTRTHEGWLQLAVTLDLFSRRIIGGSMQSRIRKEPVLYVLLMAVWRKRELPVNTIIDLVSNRRCSCWLRVRRPAQSRDRSGFPVELPSDRRGPELCPRCKRRR